MQTLVSFPSSLRYVSTACLLIKTSRHGLQRVTDSVHTGFKGHPSDSEIDYECPLCICIQTTELFKHCFIVPLHLKMFSTSLIVFSTKKGASSVHLLQHGPKCELHIAYEELLNSVLALPIQKHYSTRILQQQHYLMLTTDW